ncbi:hypothetical protein BY458DRAFT_504502 [Sporodiniella umbellata]|nr:hypothetical protein BY458DRAFT_504502 [Sporodiniella umbellata]
MSQTQPENLDTLTHPSAYRDAINCQRQSSHGSEDQVCQKQQVTKQEGDQWDLYPSMIRKVENEGTQKEVEHLHELEKEHS